MAEPIRILLQATFLLAVFLGVAACVHRGGVDFEGLKHDQVAAAERLIATGTADSLATAALLKRFGAEADEGANGLVAQAAKLAPDRADLAWLAIRLCSTAPGCDSREPEQHLRDLDPANGAGWIGALSRAQRANDAAAVDSVLTSLGRAERFYVYFPPLVVATSRELVIAQHASAGKPDRKELASAMVTMIGVIAAAVLPGSQAFAYSCKGMALEIPGRLERCRRAAQAFERGDTFLVEGLGLSLQQQLWPLDSPEGQAVTQRRRVFQYRLEKFSRLAISSSNPGDFPADYLDVLHAHEREQDSALVYFARAGIPADPPAQWTSSTLPRVP